jgi:hypothetical protein
MLLHLDVPPFFNLTSFLGSWLKAMDFVKFWSNAFVQHDFSIYSNLLVQFNGNFSKIQNRWKIHLPFLVLLSDQCNNSNLVKFYCSLQMFTFADTYRGKYDISIPLVKKYYQSQSGYYVGTASIHIFWTFLFIKLIST